MSIFKPFIERLDRSILTMFSPLNLLGKRFSCCYCISHYYTAHYKPFWGFSVTLFRSLLADNFTKITRRSCERFWTFAGHVHCRSFLKFPHGRGKNVWIYSKGRLEIKNCTLLDTSDWSIYSIILKLLEHFWHAFQEKLAYFFS